MKNEIFSTIRGFCLSLLLFAGLMAFWFGFVFAWTYCGGNSYTPQIVFFVVLLIVSVLGLIRAIANIFFRDDTTINREDKSMFSEEFLDRCRFTWPS